MAGEAPRVILLNGVGSVGKTSTALALQQLVSTPFLHVSMDGFIGMMPPWMFGHPDGMVFGPTVKDGKRAMIVTTGLVMDKVMRGMRHAIRAMAEQGNHLIVDDIMIGKGEAQEYRALLSGLDLRIVGLFAPLDVLEARERARGDREIGLARWLFGSVHQDVAYDLEIDTSHTTPVENAKMICEAFSLRRD